MAYIKRSRWTWRLVGLPRLRSAILRLAGFPLVLALSTTVSAAAATLMVGAGQTYAAPSDAARVALRVDTVHILAGTYFDCAVWSADDLTIEGVGLGTVLTDKICQGKAIFV